MEDKCNSGKSHGAKTKEPDFLLTSNTYKSIKEDEYLESRASFVGPSLSVTIGALKLAKIIGFTKRNGKTCQRCINFCSDIDASQKGTNDNIDIILNKEPGEQLLEMFQLLEKDV
ncbi:hypothetical protein V1477_016641 [Vespula maculifrons]|uniref:Uncharacterized protein n=1 Tax=Vespula maculifrons TaxID=7453 RepID=A0ABD2B8X9_VESMC